MQCSQCTRAAFYQVGEENIPLCLDCYNKFWQIQREQIEAQQREINFIADEMDMIAGLPRMGARYPKRQTVTIQGVTLHNIRINNSVVGSINTGTIEKVDVAVSVALSQGNTEVAGALKGLTEAIATSGALAVDQRSEALEILATIAEDLTAPKEKRRANMARTLSQRLREILSLRRTRPNYGLSMARSFSLHSEPKNMLNTNRPKVCAFGSAPSVRIAGEQRRPPERRHHARKDFRMKQPMLFIAVCIGLVACAREPVSEDFDRQSKKYWEQLATTDGQLKLMAEQQRKADEQIKRNDELLRRNEEIAARWEKIQERHERVLSAMEKQYSVR